MTRRLSVALALAVSGAFLVLALRNVDFSELSAVLSSARWSWIPPILAIGLLDLMVRALRWRVLLSRACCGPRPSAWLLFRLEAIGISVNNVTFMRIGELARAVLAGRQLGLHTATAFSTVAVERAMDFTALLTCFCAAASRRPEVVPSAVLRTALTGLGGAVAALAVLSYARGILEPDRALGRLLGRWPGLARLSRELADGAAILREPWPALQAAVLSLLLWGLDALIFWFGARALGLGWAVDYTGAVLVLSWAGAGAALPTAPGAFGTFEIMVKDVLVRFGAPAAEALGFAVFTHMIPYLLVTVLGLAFLYRVGLSLGELGRTLESGSRERA